MQTIGVLGCGLVGATIARDLAADGRYRVLAADRDPMRLAALAGTPRLEPAELDLGRPNALAELLGGLDAVVGALPSHLGHTALAAVIAAGKPCCDISFMPEDARDLSPRAVERGVCAVVDCGVAPGLANLAIGRSQQQLERITAARILVGGLPRERRLPWQYKAPFAPADVLEEYTRPARLRRGGRDISVAALAEPEPVEVPGVGTLEALCTDGLRSLLDTIDAPELVEKTLRYPGHAELIRALRATGLLDETPVEIDGRHISPRALTAELLFRQWRLEPGEPEFTFLQVDVSGERAGAAEQHRYRLFDQTDPNTHTSSMARTTGFPAASVARLLAAGQLTEPGVHPPEHLASQPGVWEHIQNDLAARNIELEIEIQRS
jgi:saccharopine dehydrogenase-like NADP-dependent oxidoreductase